LGIKTQREFAEAAGLEQSHYSRFESGTLQAAMKLWKRYGLTPDWLYRGLTHGLSPEIATAILALNRTEVSAAFAARQVQCSAVDGVQSPDRTHSLDRNPHPLKTSCLF
jgi:transcriptional regulator with XRE-family HTH domain